MKMSKTLRLNNTFTLISGSVVTSLGAASIFVQAPAHASGAANSLTPVTSLSDNESRLLAWQADSEKIYKCSMRTLNTCTYHEPMRSLSPEEVQLIIGANQSTNGSTHYQTRGSCTENGCQVTGIVPPSSIPLSTSVPPSAPPPDGSGGGSANAPPSAAQQQHLENCAKAYGNISPVLPTVFTDKYGWTAVDAQGQWVAHQTTDTDNQPATLPPGATTWLIIGGTTFVSAQQNTENHTAETDLYMYAYTNEATTVGDLVHEWYHQNNDTADESLATRASNEAAAQEAGKNAQAAFEADNGAKCN